jgi:hypothetical protein
MKPQNKILGYFGLTIFFIFSLLGILFFAGLNWAHLESHFYFGFNGGAETKLYLVCPHIITPQDSATVSARIFNKTDKVISPFIESQISGLVLDDERIQASVEPGQTQELKWKVGPENVTFGHLIMAQVYQFESYKTPTATATCGSLFLNLPLFSGIQLYYLTMIISLAGMLAGMLLWYSNTRKPGVTLREHGSGMIVLIVIIMIGIYFGSQGLWIFGVLALALSVIMFIIQLFGRRLSPA